MDYVNPDALVSTQWLQDNLDNPDLRIVDCTWFPASAGRIADIEYEIRHIPGAVYFDSDALCGTEPFHHNLPDADEAADAFGAIGIGNDK